MHTRLVDMVVDAIMHNGDIDYYRMTAEYYSKLEKDTEAYARKMIKSIQDS